MNFIDRFFILKYAEILFEKMQKLIQWTFFNLKKMVLKQEQYQIILIALIWYVY